MSNFWPNHVSDAEAARRAGGRRRRNKQRQILAIRRQVRALNMFYYGLNQAEIARRLGVHPATVCRYLAVLRPFPSVWRVKLPHTLEYEAGRGWRAYGYS